MTDENYENYKQQKQKSMILGYFSRDSIIVVGILLIVAFELFSPHRTPQSNFREFINIDPTQRKSAIFGCPKSTFLLQLY